MIDMTLVLTQILSPLNIPVAFQALPTGTIPPNQYITFFEIIAGPELEAADEEISTERLIQVNIWSKTDYYQLSEDVKNLLEEAGFDRTFEYDAPYSDGDSHFNKVLRFVYYDEN